MCARQRTFCKYFFDVAAPAKVNVASFVMAEKAPWLTSAHCPEQARKIMDIYSKQLEIALFPTAIHPL
jgi:hypothetical protein